MSVFDHSQVRLRFLRDAAHTCITPSVILAVALKITGVRLSYLTIPTHIAFIFLFAYIRALVHDYGQARIAGKLGARPVPCVVGKWPGNIDLVPRLLADLKSGYMQDVFLELFHEYQSTTLNLKILWSDKIITMDQEHIKYIFSTGSDGFWRGDTAKEILHSLLGEGILNSDDELWRAHRTLARPFFAQVRTSDFEIFEKHLQSVLSILANHGADEPIDIQDVIGRFTIDTASEFLFGHTLDTLSYAGNYDAFLQAFTAIQELMLKRNTIAGFWVAREFFKDESAAYAKTIRSWVDPIVKQALELKNNMRVKGIQPVDVKDATFLEYLTESTDDVNLIRDQLINFLLASRDSTTALLSFTLYLLSMHPDVMKKLRVEILEELGIDGVPTSENMKRMKYLRAVINETLRLFAPVPSNIRDTRSEGVVFPPSDPTFPSAPTSLPMYMPPNTPVLVFPFLTQRNSSLWGEDSEVFDPERWIHPMRLKKITDNPAMFVPFSLGPRVCLGQNYALNEASYFLIRLLQRVDNFSLAEDRQLAPPWIRNPSSSMSGATAHPGTARKAVEKIWPIYTIVTYIKGGLWIRLGKVSG